MKPNEYVGNSNLNTEKVLTAEQKRLHSIAEKKKLYKNNISIVKTALVNVDAKNSNKILFDDEGQPLRNGVSLNHKKARNNVAASVPTNGNNFTNKKLLFENDEEEDESMHNIDLKKQFFGKKGKELFELQSQYQNDKRFVLDERYLEDKPIENEQEDRNESMDIGCDKTLIAEKQKEYAILEEVLGKKVSKRKSDVDNKSSKMNMLRYDPSQPEHSKFEVKEPQIEETKKRKRKTEKDNVTVEEVRPVVSKEKYDITNDLKESLQNKEDFSFGFFNTRDSDKDNNESDEEYQEEVIKRHKHDSSEESEGEGNYEEGQESKTPFVRKFNYEEKQLHTDPFFFKNDDYRFQVGTDFIKSFEEHSTEEFTKLRRGIMVIARAKVKHNLRKNKPFKKKLGGGKKHLKPKKAMKR